jgi:hypothetical protein
MALETTKTKCAFTKYGARETAQKKPTKNSTLCLTKLKTILEIPSTDPVGQGIRAAAALALDLPDCENGFNMRGLLWEMAERAGFDRLSWESVQS